jgi:hypothetical protein
MAELPELRDGPAAGDFDIVGVGHREEDVERGGGHEFKSR